MNKRTGFYKSLISALFIYSSLSFAQSTKNGVNDEITQKISKYKKLEIAIPNAFEAQAEFAPLCLVTTTFKKMGIVIIPIFMPLIRSTKEAQKGSAALTYSPSFTFLGKPRDMFIAKGLVITHHSFLSEAMHLYSKENTVLSKNWFSHNQIGIIRNMLSVERSESTPYLPGNIRQFPSILPAFRSLLKNRVDVVIASELYAKHAIEVLKQDRVLILPKRKILIGEVSYYISFSEQYFGVNNAKLLADKYNEGFVDLTKTERNNCKKL